MYAESHLRLNGRCCLASGSLFVLHSAENSVLLLLFRIGHGQLIELDQIFAGL